MFDRRPSCTVDRHTCTFPGRAVAGTSAGMCWMCTCSSEARQFEWYERFLIPHSLRSVGEYMEWIKRLIIYPDISEDANHREQIIWDLPHSNYAHPWLPWCSCRTVYPYASVQSWIGDHCTVFSHLVFFCIFSQASGIYFRGAYLRDGDGCLRGGANLESVHREVRVFLRLVDNGSSGMPLILKLRNWKRNAHRRALGGGQRVEYVEFRSVLLKNKLPLISSWYLSNIVRLYSKRSEAPVNLIALTFTVMSIRSACSEPARVTFLSMAKVKHTP